MIDVRGLSYAYPDGTPALNGIDLFVQDGERVALLGPNGAGKTTLALHLNGILTAHGGSVTVAGLPVSADTVMRIRRSVGLVFQDPDDQLFLPTVGQDVAFGPANFGLDDVAGRVAAALAAVGMTEAADRPPHHLSFGQKRRVAIAGVLAADPQILVLDEPTSNLDPASRRELGQILHALPVSLLLVTHDLLFARQLCPRSVVLIDGRIGYDGPTRDLLADPDTLARFRLELPDGVVLEG